jgi:hypothetical protein
MAWETYRANDGVYLIDWDGLARIVRSCKRAGAMVDYSKVLPSEKHWFGPDLYSVEVDWDRVRLETTTQTEEEVRRIYGAARLSMRTELNRIVAMMEQADDDRDAFHDKMSEAQSKTMDNIESSVHKGEIGVEVATFVRDTSAEVVMVGATYVSGGTAAPLLTGLGAGMKGAFVYQDTGKVDKALATFSTNLLIGAADLKVGAALKGMSSASGKIGMTIVWAKGKAVLEVPKALIEGKNMNQASSAGLVKLAASTPGTAAVESLKDALGEEKEAWAIPVEVALNLYQDYAADKLSESGGKEPKETKGPSGHLPHPHPNHHLMDAVIYDSSIIERSAIRQIGTSL